MNPSMDDRHILAEMERQLSKDDPELTALMDALNRQFPDTGDTGGSDDNTGKRFDWRWKTITAFLIIALVGLILTAIFAKPSAALYDNHGPSNGRLPAVAAHMQRRTRDPGAMIRMTTTAQRRRRTTELSKGEAYACT